MHVLSCVAPFILSGESIFGCVTLMSWKSMQVFFYYLVQAHLWSSSSAIAMHIFNNSLELFTNDCCRQHWYGLLVLHVYNRRVLFSTVADEIFTLIMIHSPFFLYDDHSRVIEQCSIITQYSRFTMFIVS